MNGHNRSHLVPHSGRLNWVLNRSFPNVWFPRLSKNASQPSQQFIERNGFITFMIITSITTCTSRRTDVIPQFVGFRKGHVLGGQSSGRMTDLIIRIHMCDGKLRFTNFSLVCPSHLICNSPLTFFAENGPGFFVISLI